MANDRDALRDWHRLFGLLLTDYFSGSPFVVEVERAPPGPASRDARRNDFHPRA